MMQPDYEEENVEYMSFSGVIGRKNYAINTLIVVGLYIAFTIISSKSDVLLQYTGIKFLGTILSFMISFFLFIAVISFLSLAYRRFADISRKKPKGFKSNLKKFFVLFYVIPVLYAFCGIAIPVIDSVVILMLPVTFIVSIIIGFIKPL